MNQLTGLLYDTEILTPAAKLIQENPRNWCCIAIDIQHFKIFNAWFGTEKGDQLLKHIGFILNEFTLYEPAAASYFGRDNFGLIMHHDSQKIMDLFDQIKELIYSYSNTIGFMPAFGINMIDSGEPISIDVYEKARMAVEDAKKSYTERICYFDHEAFDQKKEEYTLLTEFQSALKNKEIGFYLQPQCRMADGKIVGAEALARWIKLDGTVIAPGVFVPFLEKHGFITEMDKCVWESVCQWIRTTLDQGINPVPISINVSQIDLLSLDVTSYLYGLVQRLNVPTRYLKIEITESAYADNYDLISKTVEQLKEKGFTVLMDDFGSGYSSLNMLEKINTDIIKLDMAFISKDTSMSKKGISIIESIISMTKTLGIPIIIEGVENAEQVAFLRSLGCLYAQGYYFYRPMSSEAFMKILTQPNICDYRNLRARETELFHAREFLDETIFPDTVLNNILGPVAFYIQDKHGALSIMRFNQRFYECIADVNMEGRTNTIQNYVIPEDHAQLSRMLKDAYEDPVTGGETTIRFYKSGGGVFWYNMHLFFLYETEQGRIFYGKIADATGMYQQSLAFYNTLKANAFSAMRIDLIENLFYELGTKKPFDDPNARAMDVIECLKLTAEKHIEDPDERNTFVSFFSPDKLRRSLNAGIYNEELIVNFILGGKNMKCRFSAYYIKFMPNQNDNVYIFVFPVK